MKNDGIGIGMAFEAFMADRDTLEAAIISSTKASWAGSGYSVELFLDGHYRVLWNNEIGNRYVSPGMILPIPALATDDFDEEDESNSFFAEVVDELIEIGRTSTG